VGMITMEDILDELVGEQNNNNVGGSNLWVLL
jgi:CBS domain containing-hemolysin-like protein